MLAKAKLASSITFIVLASFTIITCDHQNMFIIQATGLGLYYKHMTIVNDDSRVNIKWSFKLIDATTDIIYDRHMFIVQATGDIVIKLLTAVIYKFL